MAREMGLASPSRKETVLKASIKIIRERDLEYIFGLTVRDTKDNGPIAQEMDLEFNTGMMEATTQDNGKMVQEKGLGYIIGRTECVMKDSGTMIRGMEEVINIGRMVNILRGNGRTVQSTVKENCTIKMEIGCKVSGKKARYMERHSMALQMEKESKKFIKME